MTQPSFQGRRERRLDSKNFDLFRGSLNSCHLAHRLAEVAGRGPSRSSRSSPSRGLPRPSRLLVVK